LQRILYRSIMGTEQITKLYKIMKKSKQVTFKVTLDEFYIERDEYGSSYESIESELKKHIVTCVTNNIYQTIKEKIDNEITKQVTETISSHLQKKIAKIVERVVLEESIVKSSRDSTLIKLTDYIKELFISNTGWRSPNETIIQLAKKYGDEMKTRYDMMFASQIVVRLNESNMLKEGIAEKLLTKEN